MDLAAGNGEDWKEQAKTIDTVGGGGALGAIRDSLRNYTSNLPLLVTSGSVFLKKRLLVFPEAVADGIDDFKGVVARGGPVNWIMP